MSGEKVNPCKKLKIFLIKPSKYDKDGYVLRFKWGVLPSNTLSVIYGLTEDIKEKRLLGDIKIKTELIDETIEFIDYKKIVNFHKPPGKISLVCLIGVQTNMFCRARDIAMYFRDFKIPVIIGGFHVSGLLKLYKTMDKQLQELIDKGVTLVEGEIENNWVCVLSDVVKNNLKPIYKFQIPDLTDAPLPKISYKYIKKFIDKTATGTIDTSRGCPFNCSFCSVINVHGRQIRTRNPQLIINYIEYNYKKYKLNFYMFTDDNFSRNPNWEKIFDGLIKLRKEKNIKISFIMQVDTLAYKIPNFVNKAIQSGCVQVFIGIESLNPENIKETGKKQNLVTDLKEMVNTWHSFGISIHSGYIVGFPYDSENSIKSDVEQLKKLGIDQASFFILTPLPGSADHIKISQTNKIIDNDYNNFDSFNVICEHPLMSSKILYKTYIDAWKRFYTFEHMKNILFASSRRNYWNLFKFYFWYKYSTLEGVHPMLSGFLRIRKRIERRPSFSTENPFIFLFKEIRRYFKLSIDLIRLALEMQVLWLKSYPKVFLTEELFLIPKFIASNVLKFSFIFSPRDYLKNKLELVYKPISHIWEDIKIQAKHSSANISLLIPLLMIHFVKDFFILFLFLPHLFSKI